MATPIHEIMAESSAGMARERAKRRRQARILPSRFMGAGNQGIMNPNLIPAVENTARRRPWTPGSTGRMIYSTPEENEFSGGVLPDPGQYQNPYFGQKQWNPDDIGGQTWDVDYTSEGFGEAELPRWEILNRMKRLWPFNRGGIASLKHAR